MLKSFTEWVSSVNEEENSTFKFGCAMLYFNFPKMKQLHSKIKESDIYTEDGDRSFGLETEPHITLLYGLHKNVTKSKVFEICKSATYPKTITLTNPSLFTNDKYDVLKFDIHSKAINTINSALSKLPHTTDYPDYHAHATIGYLKSGKGQLYVDLFKGIKFKVSPTKVVYSTPSGEKFEFQIESSN